MAARVVWLLVLAVAWLPATVLAQEEGADEVVEAAPAEPTPAEPGDLIDIETIRQQLLQSEIEVALVDVPLPEAVRHLEQTLDIPIHIDRPALEDVGLKLHTPVSLQLKAKARTVLRLMLKELDLAYFIQPGRLVVTTPEEAESELRTVFYPVADLVFPPGTQPGSGLQPDYDTLMEVITTTVSPESWEELGGPGPINAYRGGILISQTDEIHEKIEHLLKVLREVKALKDDDSHEPRHASPTAQAEAELLRKMTKARVTLTLEETPLSDFLQILGDELEISVHIDRRALADIGETPDLALTGQWTQMPPATVLKDLLHAHGLTWYATGEVLLITTYEEAEIALITKVYPVGDLAPKPNETTLEAPRYLNSNSYTDGWLFEDLIESLTHQLDPEMWEYLGGPGSIAPYDDINALIVSQTHEVHQKLEDLLGQIREKSAALEGSPPADEAEPKADRAADKPITITYRTYIQKGEPSATAEDLQTVAQRIPKVIAPETWQDEAHYIDVLRGRLVICQRRDVQQAIEEYLRQTNVIHHGSFHAWGFKDFSGEPSDATPKDEQTNPTGFKGTGSRFVGENLECYVFP